MTRHMSIFGGRNGERSGDITLDPGVKSSHYIAVKS